MERQGLIGEIRESAPGEKQPGELSQQRARGAKIKDRCEPALLSELETRGLNKISVHEYLALQTKAAATIGFLVGSLFAVAGTLGVITSLTEVPVSDGVSLGPGPWFPAACCILGVIAIFNSNNLRRMFKVEDF